MFGEQLGPGQSSGATAIADIAIFDAVNAIAGRYQSFTGIADAPGASTDAAVAQAAHDTLTEMFPSQRAECDRLLADDVSTLPSGPAKNEGVKVGRRAARAILDRTKNDRSQRAEPRVAIEYITESGAGQMAAGSDQPTAICVGSGPDLKAEWDALQERKTMLQASLDSADEPQPNRRSGGIGDGAFTIA